MSRPFIGSFKENFSIITDVGLNTTKQNKTTKKKTTRAISIMWSGWNLFLDKKTAAMMGKKLGA